MNRLPIHKLLVLTSLSILLASCFGPKSKIKGSLSGADWNKVYLYSVGSRDQVLDSAEVINGKFEINTELIKSQLCMIGYDRSFANVFVVNAPMEVQLFLEEKELKAEVSGSPEHTAYYKYRERLSKSDESKKEQECSQKIKEANAAKNESLSDSLREEYSRLNAAYWKFANAESDKLMEEYRDSPLGLFLYYRRHVYFQKFYTQAKIDSVRSEYLSFGPRALNSALPEIIENYLAPFEKVVVGKPAPGISGNDVSGNPQKLSDFQGKYVLVDFWASWCYWCRLETPTLIKAHEMFDEDQFVILGVSFDMDHEKWKAAIEEDESHWNQIVVSLDERKRINKEYSFTGIPHIMLVGPDGTVLARELRGEKIIEAIKEHLKS